MQLRCPFLQNPSNIQQVKMPLQKELVKLIERVKPNFCGVFFAFLEASTSLSDSLPSLLVKPLGILPVA